jgi:hypothetical protein
MQTVPKKKVLRFAVGDSSVFRFWVTGDDAYCAVRAGASVSKISIHKSGTTLVSLGAQKRRFRLLTRVNVGSGWELVLFLVFPSIQLDPLEKPAHTAPSDTLRVTPASVGKKKNLVFYSSVGAGSNPPPFGRQELIGPFVRRDSGSYWIFCTESDMSADEERGLQSVRAEAVFPLKSDQMPKSDAYCLLWFPKPERSEYPLVVCAPLDKRNYRPKLAT